MARGSWNQRVRVRKRRLAMEKLDARICLAADPVFDPATGLLTIGGSPEADTILVRDLGGGAVSVRDGDSRNTWDFTAVERIVIDSGEGDDTIRFDRRGGSEPLVPDLDIQSGEGDDTVAIGLLLPAVQKVRAAAARLHVDLGDGQDELRVRANGLEDVELDVTAGEGDDQLLIGLLLPAVQKVREAAARANTQFDLGGGDDHLRFDTGGVEDVELDLTAGEGDDEVAIGLLLPAVQKVREAAARAQARMDLGDGDDRARVRTHGVSDIDLSLTAGDGDDEVAIGLLLPAVQKVREAAARAQTQLDLGGGDDRLRFDAGGFDDAGLDLTAGDGDDEVAIGLLLPAVQKVREAAGRAQARIDLGDGDDRLSVRGQGVSDVGLDVTAGGGDDAILIGLLLPAVQKVRAAAARLHVDLGPGADTLEVRERGYETFEADIVADADDDVTLPRGRR